MYYGRKVLFRSLRQPQITRSILEDANSDVSAASCRKFSLPIQEPTACNLFEHYREEFGSAFLHPEMTAQPSTYGYGPPPLIEWLPEFSKLGRRIGSSGKDLVRAGAIS
jgi:hypothetical protein